MSGLTRVMDLAARELAGRGGGDVLGRLRLQAMWHELVGGPLARQAQPQAIQNGTLVIAVPNPTWHGTLQTMIPRLLATASQRCPELGITRIRIVLGEPPRPAPETPAEADGPDAAAIDDIALTASLQRTIEQTASVVEDPALRARLVALMRRDHQVRQWRLRHGWQVDPATGDLRPPADRR